MYPRKEPTRHGGLPCWRGVLRVMTAATSVALAACIFVNSQVLCLRLMPRLDTGQSFPRAVHTTCTSKSFFSALAQVQVCAVVVQAHKQMLESTADKSAGNKGCSSHGEHSVADFRRLCASTRAAAVLTREGSQSQRIDS